MISDIFAAARSVVDKHVSWPGAELQAVQSQTAFILKQAVPS